MKVTTKMSAAGFTLDECIEALEALKKKGVPGETLLGVPLAEQVKIRKALDNENQNGTERSYNRPSPTVETDRKILHGARLTFWVEFEA